MLVIESGDEFSQLRPVVSQKALRAVRGATRNEVEALMNQLGFIRRYEDNYVNVNQTLFIEDLHDQNVLVDATGDLLIFDPVIYLKSQRYKKSISGRSYFSISRISLFALMNSFSSFTSEWISVSLLPSQSFLP